MVYKMMCPECGMVDEYVMLVSETDVEIPCSNCKTPLTRDEHRYYEPEDAPSIFGDTCSKN